ncbi:PREDICTED: T-cell surface glycoprotein CD3 epsilon chain [Poecilia mexicana]|uniref:CD3e molecule n=2 Tax=Poecilia TaxID=8080 RepID=A0A087XKB8_POEFO|nr:PREDICTED: T-cell surface glycoprotein CD3 epsilon chain [Poecilia mexicana]XP_016518351.1 PREDICTED: T-cell surface glycoprotein CD3 epsilon chain [Poecilia formosa]
MVVQAVFVVIFMFATSVKAETTVKGGAEFSKKEVTLTCPGDGAWYEGQPTTPKPTILPRGSEKKINTYTFTYERQVLYRCEPNSNIYYFYVRGRACENCFELDPKLFVTFIVVDVIMTAVVMMIIYRCSKKKSSDGPTPSVKPTPRAGHRAPHGPSEYETLNPNTRSQDTYSTVVNSGMVNRTG